MGAVLSDKRQNTIGVLCLFGVALCWGFVASTVKRLSAQLDPYTISFFRVLMATLVFAGLFALQKGDWRRLPWFWPWMLVGALGRASNYVLYNAGVARMPSNVATVTAPVQTVAVLHAKTVNRISRLDRREERTFCDVYCTAEPNPASTINRLPHT